MYNYYVYVAGPDVDIFESVFEKIYLNNGTSSTVIYILARRLVQNHTFPSIRKKY